MSRQIWFLRCLLGLLVAVIIVFLITHNRVSRWTCGSSCRSQTSETVEPRGLAESRIPVTMVVVTCGDRFEVTMANLKSAVAFSRAPLRLLLFADAENIQRLDDTIKDWPANVLERVTYELRLVRPPKGPDMIKE
uniref:Putative glycosyltransferase domain-containing protein n=1 Tax=Ixodes ricinus TaxID=34613 RepID=A0A0K8RJL7_IXORI